MTIRLMWGYWRPIEENVVAITVRRGSELELALHGHTNGGGSSYEVEIKKSAPLGLPLAAMHDMQTNYGRYVEEIVNDDLQNYVLKAYKRPQGRPGLPECLLQTITSFYTASVAADDKVWRPIKKNQMECSHLTSVKCYNKH